MCRGIVEHVACWVPGRECLELVLAVVNVKHFGGLAVVEYKVAGIVYHLYLLRVAGVEHLPGLVYRIGHQILFGMPCRIDTSRQGVGGLEVYLRHLSLVYEHRSTIILPYMKLGGPLSVVVLCHMAVYALSVVSLAMHTVAVEHPLVKGSDIALAEHHLLIVYV